MSKIVRDRKITLRLTEEEYLEFHRKYELSDFRNQSEFFISCLNRKEIIIINALRETLIELKKEGINLNQAVRYANETGVLVDIQTTLNNMNTVYKKLYEMEMNPPCLSSREELDVPNLAKVSDILQTRGKRRK